MPSLLLTAFLFAIAYYYGTFIYNFIRNYRHAQKSNFPFWTIPWDQNGFVWMIVSVPLRPYLRKYLPTWMYNKLTLTIYGFEFHDKLRMFEEYAHGPTPNGGKGNGMTYVMVTPGSYELSTCDPEILLEVLRRPRDFAQHKLTGLFMGQFGSNLLVTDGDVWARQRKVVASTINERISKTIFKESVVQTEGLLDEVMDVGGETNRMFDMMKKITINVLSGAGMGAPIIWKENENGEPRKGYKMTYIAAVKVVIESIAGPIILPEWFLSRYPTWLPGGPFFKELGIAKREFPAHTKDMLAKERERSEHAGAEGRSNIMSQLLLAAEKGEKGGKALSDEEMMGNLWIFTAAGFDTTANTLAYSLVLLARYPQWQEWMFEEIDKILPEDNTAELDYQAIYPKATRIMATMFETLRVFPPLIHMSKETNGPQTITTSTGSYWFPANATVYVNVVAVHLNASVWRNLNLQPSEKPSDTDEKLFRPSRWINPDHKPESADSQPLWQPPKGTFVPWSAGPRVCPGQKMAQVEFTSIFLTLFRRYRLEAVPLISADGKEESRSEIDARLDARMKDSVSILTLMMNDVYKVGEGDGKGLKLRLVKRK